jgi:hypothetical protein
MNYRDAVKELLEEHSNLREYYVEFNNLFSLVPKSDSWNKYKEFSDYYKNHFLPHMEYEEELIKNIGDTDSHFLENKVIKTVLLQHKDIVATFEELLKKESLSDDSISSVLEAMDSILKHAKYEDDEFIPLIKNYIN